MNTFFAVLAHPFAMLIYGLLLHALKQLSEAAMNDSHVTPWLYLKQWPYSAGFALVSALAGYGALYGTDELTRINAFGLGYMANSVADMIGHRGLEALTHGLDR